MHAFGLQRQTESLRQLNPTVEKGRSIDEVVDQGAVRRYYGRISRPKGPRQRYWAAYAAAGPDQPACREFSQRGGRLHRDAPREPCRPIRRQVIPVPP